MRIGYLTDDPGPDYSKALTGASTRETLVAVLRPYKRVAADALAIAEGMTDAEFKDFRAGLAKERRGQFAGEPWALKFGAVVMPDVMMHVSIVAEQFKVPWGTAFVRMLDVGRLAESEGVARVVDAPATAPAAGDASR